MPASKQIPLTAPRGRDPHDFAQPYPHWEAAVFDDAAYFFVYSGREGIGLEIPTMAEAVAEVAGRGGICIYAVSRQGRNVLLDREKWPEWITREKESQGAS